MPREDWKVALRWDLTMNGYKWDHGGDTEAIVSTVMPHIEAAYKRGHEAGSSRAGYRLVQENERLRRELEFAERCLNERG